jgi:hypothetical protein
MYMGEAGRRDKGLGVSWRKEAHDWVLRVASWLAAEEERAMRQDRLSTLTLA